MVLSAALCGRFRENVWRNCIRRLCRDIPATQVSTRLPPGLSWGSYRHRLNGTILRSGNRITAYLPTMEERQGQFIADGEITVADLLDSPIPAAETC
jgi:hypothetical protein